MKRYQDLSMHLDKLPFSYAAMFLLKLYLSVYTLITLDERHALFNLYWLRRAVRKGTKNLKWKCMFPASFRPKTVRSES